MSEAPSRPLMEIVPNFSEGRRRDVIDAIVAALQVPGLKGRALAAAAATPRIGHLAVAVARSWSNVVTASAGIVSVIGGPLPTGRRRAIDQVIRTTAPMHDGFAGGAFIDTSGAPKECTLGTILATGEVCKIDYFTLE